MPNNSPSFPAISLPLLDEVPLPPVQRVRLTHPRAEPIGALDAALERALAASVRLAQLPADAKVAVAVGSRGIARIDEVVRATVAWLKSRGLAPFIVPAMGSHGGATAAGQAAVLAQLGVTEERVGAPLRATMDVVDYGATDEGVRCYFDAHAAAADAVVLIARVKSHTRIAPTAPNK